MSNQKEVRPYSLYLSKDILQQSLNKGYEEVAFSMEIGGYYKTSERIVRMSVLYHPDGNILTYEHREIDDSSLFRRLKPFKYSLKDKRELSEFRLKQFNVKLGEKRNIRNVLDDIIGWEFR